VASRGIERLNFDRSLDMSVDIRMVTENEAPYRVLIEGADESVAISILGGGDWSFGFEDGVDTSHCVAG
jgi:hypothetical protein